MAPRANWKGHLKLALVTCPVALYTAVATADRIAFRTLNRATGNPVRREFVDEETGEIVEREDQVKGYAIGKDEHVVLTEEEIDAAIPESTKTIDLEAFVPDAEVDDLYLDSPYYLAPAEGPGREAFAAIREAMRAEGVAGLARTVLFQRERMLLLCPRDKGFIASTLHFDHEVEDAGAAFGDIRRIDIPDEMLDLARQIINARRGTFDPDAFEDRYEEALIDLVRAKEGGRRVRAKPRPRLRKAVDLLAALRKSAAADVREKGRKPPRAATASGRKAG